MIILRWMELGAEDKEVLEEEVEEADPVLILLRQVGEDNAGDHDDNKELKKKEEEKKCRDEELKVDRKLKKREVEEMWFCWHLERREAKVGGGDEVPEQGPQVVQLLRPLSHSLIDEADQLLELVDACQPIERSLWI